MLVLRDLRDGVRTLPVVLGRGAAVALAAAQAIGAALPVTQSAAERLISGITKENPTNVCINHCFKLCTCMAAFRPSL